MTDLEYRKRVYEMRKRDGVCVRCGQEDAFTMVGHAYCSVCRDAENAAMAKWRSQNRDQINKKQNQMYAERRALGLCTRCGKPAEEGHKWCASCRKKDSQRCKKRYAQGYRAPKTRPDGPKPTDDLRRELWVEHGLCWMCGAPAEVGFHACEKCHNTLRITLSRAREAAKAGGYQNNAWVKNNRNFWKNWRRAHGMTELEEADTCVG